MQKKTTEKNDVFVFHTHLLFPRGLVYQKGGVSPYPLALRGVTYDTGCVRAGGGETYASRGSVGVRLLQRPLHLAGHPGKPVGTRLRPSLGTLIRGGERTGMVWGAHWCPYHTTPVSKCVLPPTSRPNVLSEDPRIRQGIGGPELKNFWKKNFRKPFKESFWGNSNWAQMKSQNLGKGKPTQGGAFWYCQNIAAHPHKLENEFFDFGFKIFKFGLHSIPGGPLDCPYGK